MLLEVEGLNVYYGSIHALHDLSFTVGEGEIVTLIGANGAGKSTTLRTVSGLLRPRSGSVTFQGVNITTTAADKIVTLGISHVPEGRKIFAPLTVRENLEMGAYTRKDKAEIPSHACVSASASLAARSRAASSKCWQPGAA
jgi:branched-chain amino acid transport system ATP-binding protein